MDVRFLTANGVESRGIGDVRRLLERGDGFVWVDVPEPRPEELEELANEFGFHPLALQACAERSHVPKIHPYPDHVFLVLHAPEAGAAGHVHLMELDQFVGLRYLVTVHGPLGEGVPLDSALRETTAALRRMEEGRFRPASPAELSHTITRALARRMELFVASLATTIAALERRVMTGKMKDPEQELEEMFRVRHELLTVRTMAAQSKEAASRMNVLARFLPPESHPYVEDLLNEFDRVRSLADGEKEFLQGVVDYYESRTTTKINIAMERLALIAAVILPINAIAGIYGMNIIVNDRTDFGHLAVLGGLIALISGTMLAWAKRHGWW
ncbi:MAG: magnesium transporter CorA family protein [Actinobacteria bacterium]|nr:magnesium transporter CorA family protein [Actinomycetota bacterium]